MRCSHLTFESPSDYTRIVAITRNQSLTMKSYIIACVAIGILLSPLIVLCIRQILSRRDVLRIMSENVCDDPTFAAVNTALATVNTSCDTYTFNAERTANILFEGRQFSLILGHVGRMGAG